MPRVSSFGLNQVLIADLQRNQGRVAKGQQQINSGKVTDQYRGLSREVETLLGAKSLRTRNFNHLDVIAEMNGRLEFNNLHLVSMFEQMETLRSRILSAIANEETAGLTEELNQSLLSVVGSLNSKVGDVFLFGGTRTDVAPVTVSSLSELEAAPSAASVFQNSQTKPAARIDEAITMEFGLLANEIGEPLLDVLRDISLFNNGASGPLDGALNATQRTFLESMLPKLEAATQNLSGITTVNGVRLNRLEVIRDRVETNVSFLSTFISDIEDTDMTEAILNLNADQSALDASFSALSTLFDVSLLNFI
ncbi:MAG: flagellin [Sphingomonadales bacterium]